MKETIDKFIDELKLVFADETFVKLTLGNYKGSDEHLQKIFVRPVEIKKGSRLLFQYRHDNHDTAKNFGVPEAIEVIRKHLDTGFRSAHLFTADHDIQLTIGKRNARLTSGKPTTKQASPSPHNREKNYRIDPSAYYLKALGITTDKGEVIASQQDKWRQINKFVEILVGLIEHSDLNDQPTLKIIDMGSGKGYLTFAAYDYLANQHPTSSPYQGGVAAASVDGVVRTSQDSTQRDPADVNQKRIQMTGVEQRPELVELCNQIAQAGNFAGLKFVHGTIADFDPGEIDILIALHACDTATDDALFKGITGNAAIIVAAPCCHKEIRKQIKPPEMLAGILKHGIMLERTAETITDGLRSLILEREGYRTKLFEFVPTEHTPKNNMLVATRSAWSRPGAANGEIRDLMASFGIQTQRLETLLTTGANAAE